MNHDRRKIDELESRLGNGDKEALATLFDCHRDRLRHIVYFRMNPMLQQRLEPDDVLQEAYIEAAKRMDHFVKNRFASSFLWLRLIANQTLIDMHRRHLGAQARDVRREVALEGLMYSESTSSSMVIQLAASATSPSQLATRHQLVGKVTAVVNRLEPLDQEILALRHFEELTNSETANVLGIEQKAASIRYVRALQRLKSALADVPGFFTERQDG